MFVGLFLVASPCEVLGQAPMSLAPTPRLHRPVLEALGWEKLVELPDFLLKVTGDVIWGLVNSTLLKNLVYYRRNDLEIFAQEPQPQRLGQVQSQRRRKRQGRLLALDTVNHHPAPMTLFC